MPSRDNFSAARNKLIFSTLQCSFCGIIITNVLKRFSLLDKMQIDLAGGVGK